MRRRWILVKRELLRWRFVKEAGVTAAVGLAFALAAAQQAGGRWRTDDGVRVGAILEELEEK